MAKQVKFEKPEDGYNGLSIEELQTLVDNALDEYGELVKIDDADYTDEQLDRMEELKTEIAAVRAEVATQTEAAEARAARIAAAKEAPVAAEGDDDEDGDDEEVEAEEEADEEEGDDEEEEAEEAPAEKEAILASAAKPTNVVRAAARRRPARKSEVEEELPVARTAKINAATEVRGFTGGQELTMDQMVEAFTTRLMAMPGGGKKRVGKQFSKYGVTTISKPGEERYDEYAISDRTSPEDAWRKIMSASKESNLGTGANALLAAGGWCAPSENFYDLCAWETATGALDLPTITVTRGGINFTKGPDFSTIYNDSDVSFTQTEAQAEAGTEKPFLEIDCPDWTEVRLDAIGYGVKAPILTASPAGFPELIRRYLEGVLVAHYHKVNTYVIGKVVTDLGAAQNFAELGSASSDLLNAIEVAVWSLRYKYRLAETHTMEAMFPAWIKGALRADLSRRTGVDLINVTDQVLEAWFRLRGIRAQYVYDWQDMTGTDLQFPSSVQFGIWPAGTFVKGENSIISLDAIYDSTEIETNTYTAAFFEEAILVANTCGDGRLFQVGLNVYGRTGAADLGASFADS